MLRLGSCIFLFLISITCSFAQFQSVLAEGYWVKLGITKSGIYKIDAAYLSSIGFNTNTLDPSHIAIFGNAQGMLPQNNAKFRLQDLYENPIYVVGEEDGKFDASDYIIFYGQGPDTRYYDSTASMYRQIKNIYSDTAYYFITLKKEKGKRISTLPSIESTPDTIISQFQEMKYVENDLVSILKSGRDWFGEIFDARTTFTYDFSLEDRIENTPINFITRVALKHGLTNASQARMYFNYFFNDRFMARDSVLALPTCGLCNIGTTGGSRFTFNPNTNVSTFKLRVDFNRNGFSGSTGYIDYITYNYTRSLSLQSSNQILFSQYLQTPKTVQFNLTGNNAESMVWDITTPYNPYLIKAVPNGNISFQDIVNAQTKSYAYFNPSLINEKPATAFAIQNQNIRGQSTPHLIIVTHPLILNQALRLASHRESQGINTSVFLVNQIYNEFSSGMQDMTAIRDMARYFYQKDSSKLKNILLFGGASVDYKNRLKNNTNLVPTYQSYNSLHEIFSYASEDYFAFFGTNDGDWQESRAGDHFMYIGVGRIPASNSEQATEIVNRLINYDRKENRGNWSNRYIFVSDNGSGPNEGNIFLNDTERLIEVVNFQNTSINPIKLYIDAYPMLSKSTGLEAPFVKEGIRNQLNKGAAIFNYVGHGGPTSLAQENIVNKNTIDTYTNYDKLPFWITATCDFSTYDNPEKLSAGYYTMLGRRGGGIGLLTATRVVFQSSNFRINQAFYQSLYNRDSVGKPLTLGEIIKLTKNRSLSGVNNRSYTLIGDPSMTLALPEHKVVITAINNKPTDTAQAQKKIILSGEVRHFITDQVLTDFDGIAYVEVFDKEDTIPTLGQQFSIATTFLSRRSVVFNGRARVKNGLFDIAFYVPKDINYRIGDGKVSVYAISNKGIDASGSSFSLKIGGSAITTIEDNTPPEIQLYLEDTLFRNGGLVSSTPLLIANLFDEYGINVAGASLGHDITLSIDGDDQNLITLNDFYTNNLDSYQSGTLSFILPPQTEGSHYLTLKAWDINNNSSTATIHYRVGNVSKLELEDVYSYPNPASENVTFSFTHNKVGEDLDVSIDIYNSTGSVVHSLNQKISNSKNREEITWQNIKSDYKILPGLYFYKLSIRSMQNNFLTESMHKLVIAH